MVRREELFARATDPQQYDAPGLDWPREGILSSPAMRFFHGYLRRELEDVRGKSVIDIGCGTGHLHALLTQLGARRVVGLEPSARNAAIARREARGLEVIEGALQDAQFSQAFDLAVAVMSFEHQPDLPAAFRRVSHLLKPGGTFYLVAGDKEFHLAPRFGLRLETYEMPDGSAVVATGFAFGTIHDVVRPVAHYERAARDGGFAVVRRVALVPTVGLFAADPRWREFEGRPVAHLVVARRGGG